jgi:hypothetical protein
MGTAPSCEDRYRQQGVTGSNLRHPASGRRGQGLCSGILGIRHLDLFSGFVIYITIFLILVDIQALSSMRTTRYSGK